MSGQSSKVEMNQHCCQRIVGRIWFILSSCVVVVENRMEDRLLDEPFDRPVIAESDTDVDVM
jgi:hypothetical protein